MDGHRCCVGGTSCWRVVLHLDLDAFYCQVEHRRLNIEREKPLAVRQWEGLIAVNYPARAKGVGRFCNIEQAREKCPDLVLVHVETIGNTTDGGIGEVKPNRTTTKVSLQRYRKASFEVIQVIQKFSSSSCIERASIDEVYIDITASVEEKLREVRAESSLNWNTKDSHVAEGAILNPSLESDLRLILGSQICKEIRDAVKSETEFDMSAGIAHNKQMAKLASSLNKPAKQTIVPSASVPSMMQSLPYTAINGLGGKLGEKLKTVFPEAETAQDLQMHEKPVLQAALGESTGFWLYNLCRGLVDEAVEPNLLPKSLNACKSGAFNSMKPVKHWLKIMCQELIDRIQEDNQNFGRMPRVLALHARSSRTNKERSSQSPLPGNGSMPSLAILFDASLKLFEKLERECLPCSRVAIGARSFVSDRKDMQKLSDLFASSRPKEDNDGSSKRKRKPDPIQQAKPKVKETTKQDAGSVDIDGIDVREQKYILSLLEASKKPKPKMKKSGQTNLAQLWGAK